MLPRQRLTKQRIMAGFAALLDSSKHQRICLIRNYRLLRLWRGRRGTVRKPCKRTLGRRKARVEAVSALFHRVAHLNAYRVYRPDASPRFIQTLKADIREALERA